MRSTRSSRLRFAAENTSAVGDVSFVDSESNTSITKSTRSASRKDSVRLGDARTTMGVRRSQGSRHAQTENTEQLQPTDIVNRDMAAPTAVDQAEANKRRSSHRISRSSRASQTSMKKSGRLEEEPAEERHSRVTNAHDADGLTDAVRQSASMTTLPFRSRQNFQDTRKLTRQSESQSTLPAPESVDYRERSASPYDATDKRNRPPLSDITNSDINEQNDKPMDTPPTHKAVSQPAADDSGSPKPRLVISYLALTNFKSYSGRQVVGPFHPSFSSVVGPNGSGKSNVIDSLLFVFGFRASKMRQGKVSALIHNSAQFPNLQFCEVEVHFQEVIDQPSGGCQVVTDSQLVLSRRAFKNNSSKYYLNGKETNFTAVTDLLRARGIDLDHKRFLILQGEVESIAQMKPKAANEHDDGLLEYLEDIIGTSKYKAPINEAAAGLEELNEVCLEKQNRVQHVEKEKSGLEDRKTQALAFIHDENKLVEKQAALYQIYIEECTDNIRVTEEAIAEMQELFKQEIEKQQGGEGEIRELQKQYKEGLRQCEAMAQRTEAMVKEVAKYDKELVKLEEKKKFLLGKQKKLEKEIQQERLSSSECSSLIQKSADDIEKKTAEIASFESELSVEEGQLTAIRESLRGKTQPISDRIAEKQASLEPWNKKINEKISALTVAESELVMVNDRRNASSVALNEIKSKISSIQKKLQEKLAELETRQEEKAALEAEVQKIEGDLQKVASREPEIRARISGARQKAEEARASLMSVQNQGAVLSGLLRLKDTGRIDGFHGRLGNLGTIDDKYDVAISTACPSLQNLVVDSVEVGQHCIDYLRKNNLGRANFILLDRLPKRDLSSIYTPENVPRLFDLVRPKDPKFAPAFYSVLRDTLVARDLEQANRIAFGARRWRVVTLDGQLIDVSGTMSGGGTKVAKGGMSSKLVADVSKEQVAKLEAERDEIERKWDTFQERQHRMEEVLRGKKDELPKLQTVMQKIQLETESFSKNIKDAQHRAKEIAAESKPSKADHAKAQALEKQIATLKAQIEKLRSETVEVEKEIQALHNQIMEIGGVKLRGQKAKVDGLKEQIAILTEEISNAELSRSKSEKEKANHDRRREVAEQKIVQLQAEQDQLQAQYEVHYRDVSSMRTQTEEAQEALQTRKEELAALRKEADEKTAELNSTRASEIEMRNRLEENQKALAENSKRLDYWKDKLGKLTLHNISDFTDEADSTQEIPIYTKDELADMDKDSLKALIATLEEKTQNASVDLSVLQEYRRRVSEYEMRSADLQEAIVNRDNAKARLASLRSLRLNGFMEGFNIISLRLKEMYQMITMGGNAELELVDSLDPFSEGILFSVMPPKKSWKNISNLSGGEKTLSSLALVFALHHYRPTPLYVMDEIDAALDFRNVSIVASYIKERTRNAQFIVISLRNNMFELASRLIGVYKVNHMTKSVTIENKDFIERRN
ncbi:hypothetical protein KEM54_002604 [Ascosphaera aggregata]|nr:hypothetical protein KEM54_002604 [Ascosphaera aggregata]